MGYADKHTYHVLRSRTSHGLSDTVTLWIKDNWIPQGGVSYKPGDNRGYGFYIQAMTKERPKKQYEMGSRIPIKETIEKDLAKKESPKKRKQWEVNIQPRGKDWSERDKEYYEYLQERNKAIDRDPIITP